MKVNKIIKNFLSEKDFFHIKNIITGSEFPWYRQKGIAELDLNNNAECYFTHIFYVNYEINSQYFNDLSPLINKLIDSVKGETLIRMKANFYLRTEKIVEHDFHVDFNFDHKTAVYSINTNNGYTKFEDGSKAPSIENQIVKFNGGKKHKSTSCTDIFGRINIGINYE